MIKELKEIAKRKLAKLGLAPKTCGVRWCDHTQAEVVELEPFDPVDHTSTIVQLCPEHRVWADKRNEFAEEMAEELRAKRREIGQANLAKVQELAVPQGNMREDVLMGELEDGQYLTLDDALEDAK